MPREKFFIAAMDDGIDDYDKAQWVEVEGFVFGVWGVHQQPERHMQKGNHCDEYPITHVPTGLMILSFNKIKPAREFARLLSKTKFRVDWNDLDAGNLDEVDRYKRNYQRLFNIYKLVEEKFGMNILSYSPRWLTDRRVKQRDDIPF